MTCSCLTKSLKLEMENRVDLIFRRESNFYQSRFVRSLIMTMNASAKVSEATETSYDISKQAYVTCNDYIAMQFVWLAPMMDDMNDGESVEIDEALELGEKLYHTHYIIGSTKIWGKYLAKLLCKSCHLRHSYYLKINFWSFSKNVVHPKMPIYCVRSILVKTGHSAILH